MATLPEVNSIQFHRPPRWRAYGTLLKSLQTGLLVLTGVAGLSSAHGLSAGPRMWSGLIVSLLLAIGGSTVLNMVYDRDIDRRMQRTCSRPLPQGVVSVREAVVLGSALTGSGVLVAFALSSLYGVLIAAGVFTDLVVYTLWLKRRSPWSIVWGGIAGAMPIVAGRALGMGVIDGPAVALGLSVLLWIPTHILTFNLRYEEDYRRAGIPTIPQVYGQRTARRLISVSSVLGALAMLMAASLLGLGPGYLRLLAVLGLGLIALAIRSALRPSARINLVLFKSASAFMLSGMLIIGLDMLG